MLSREFTYHGSDGWPLRANVLGSGPTLILLHGGGPDHHSLMPLAYRLASQYTVVVPDIRGYGRSVCPDPARHTWAQYADDVHSLIETVGAPDEVGLIGTGMGATISLRAGLAYPDRIRRAVLISIEDIEDDKGKAAETELMERFAEKVRTEGIEAGWQLFLPALQPLIANLVSDAIPRSDPASVAAAAAIGRDRAFRTPAELTGFTAQTLIIAGDDKRHPAALAQRVTEVLPDARLAPVTMAPHLRTAQDMAEYFAPAIKEFLAE
ncbi:alpha/beta fold hydrolase [Nocardia barduliensis]|uniref:alpha/beta fold hydrolase n=1 Tax=Nocardia barduliensis TaxID=2736643 RepID=UPI0028A6C9C0|nr:alpha/beta hydrolase [Nocardia barduliensis]